MRIVRIGLFVLLAWAIVAAGGCAVFEYVVAQFAPPKTVKAEYDPPKGKTVLVFVEDDGTLLSYEPIKEELTERVGKEIVAQGICAKTVPYQKLMGLVSQEPNFKRIWIGEVGQRLGADLVLYVVVNHFSLKETEVSSLWRGELKTTVKLVDSKTGLLWPKDRTSGFPLSVIERPSSQSVSQAYALELTRALAEKMSVKVARLFYEHKVPERELEQEGQEHTDTPQIPD
jgi:hypothetical protein